MMIAPLLALTGMLAACQENSTVTRLDDGQAAATIAPISRANAHSDEDELSPRILRRFAPISEVTGTGTSPLVSLGRMLYFEPLLSRTGTVSCNSCHPLDKYGATNTAVSTGVDGKQGSRNAPSTYNAAGHFRQFWDGRAATLGEQAQGPIQNPAEMGMESARVVQVLAGVEGYRQAFARAYPGQAQPISFSNVSAAIAEFESGLITPGRWDRYLLGDKSALTQREKDGAKLFSNLGCMVCHTGAYIGGTMFEKLGVHLPWPNQQDRGRSQISKSSADDMVFKVPSLRNVANTSPYFHDGSVTSLKQAVLLMSRHQLGEEVTGDEADDIVAWLGSLTGRISLDYIRTPSLPVAQRP
jgi:cytochrome c peroxidase